MKKRADSFFGIHFDFHAFPGETVGADFRPEVVAELLDRVKPDYVQCDTKGHPGLSSYPTRIGTQADYIKEDVLKMWRGLTKERDIALYAHHSGLFDENAAKIHPEWALKDEEGNVSEYYMSVFGPYADELLIPQLKELALDYKLDGAWVDGECWATFVDYSDHAVNAYRKEYGKDAPKSGDEDYEQYKEFCRKGFEEYVAHYIEEIKKIRPDFEITSNWMYSAFMPEKVNVNLDFLSGDYSPFNAVETARHNARCLAARSMPWDLMAWGQNSIPANYTSHNRSTKEYEQYCQEAAIVISLGGGFQFFNIMYGGGGTVQPWAIPMWEKVAKFCREREFLHKSKAVHQIGIIYPLERVKKDDTNLYSDSLDCYKALCSWNNCMLDCGYSTEFIYESSPGELKEYPVIVLGDARDLKEKTISLLKDYVEDGGRLIVDLKSAKYFVDFAGVEKSDNETRLVFIEGNEALAAVDGEVCKFFGDCTVSGKMHPDNYFTDENFPGAINKKIGKGNITFMCMDFSKAYAENITSAIKEYMKNIVSKTEFKPLVEISGSSYAELSVANKDGKLIINIVNTAGPSALYNVRGYNEVPKIGPIRVRIRKDNIKKIIRMPENEELCFTYFDGYAETLLDIVHIHTAIVVEEEK